MPIASVSAPGLLVSLQLPDVGFEAKLELILVTLCNVCRGSVGYSRQSYLGFSVG
jgi:hypothetical protein